MILGGIGSIPGVVVGALVLIGLPGLLREFEEYRLLDLRRRAGRDHDPAAAGAGPERPPEPRAARGRPLAGRVGRETVARPMKHRRRGGCSPPGRRARVSRARSWSCKGVAQALRRAVRARRSRHARRTPARSLSVIGPNGAGKSTMFNVITGLYEPDDGDVTFRGESIVGLAPNQITRLGIARTFQNVHLFPNMTVLENAMVGQHCRSKSGVFGVRASGCRARGARRSGSGSRAQGGPRLLRLPARRLPAGPAGVLALVREPPPARDGPRAWRPSRRSCCSTSRRPG